MRDYWLHALGAAAMAAGVGQHLRDPQRPFDVLYLTGLLHNLGSLVLVHLRPKKMDRVYAAIAAGDRDGALALERQLIGVDRWQAGEWLAFRCHLPEPVTHTLGQLNNPTYDGESLPILEVVRAACEWMLANDSDEPIDFRVRGLDAEVTAAVAEELIQRWEELVGLANTVA